MRLTKAAIPDAGSRFFNCPQPSVPLPFCGNDRLMIDSRRAIFQSPGCPPDFPVSVLTSSLGPQSMFFETTLADALHQFATLFAVVDPVGTVPVFIAVTATIAPDRRRAVAYRAVLFAALVLMGFLIAGQPVLNAIDVNLTSFQIAGGIVLFLFALTMIFGDSKPDREISEVSKNVAEWAVYPLAIPSIASPGAMLAVVVLTDNDVHSIAAQAVTAGITLAVLGLSLVLMLVAMPVQRLIGKAGASIVSRVMGLILAAVAVDHVISAIILRFGL